MTSPPHTTNAERWLLRALVLALALAALMSLAATFLLTLGFDEAWILLGIDGIVHPVPRDLAVAPVISNGGFFAVGQLAVSAVAGRTLWPHRLFVLLCLVAALALVMRRGRRTARSTAAMWLAPAVLVGLPGTLVLGASGYASVPAFLLLLCVVELWETSETRRWVRRFVCGALAGLAAATRLEVAVLMPALIIVSLVQRDGRRRRLADSCVATLVAAPVLLACMTALSHAVRIPGLDATTVSSMTGMRGALFDYPRLLNKWVIGESFLPPALLVLATLVAWVMLRGAGTTAFAAPAVLIASGWLLWLAWITRSPIAHLRYLWPALACFAVVLGLGLTRLHAWGVTHDEPVPRVAALLLALACVVTALGSTLRALAQGDANILSWEWSRETPIDYFRRFQHLHDQRAAAQYLRQHVSNDQTVAVLGLDMELRYLTGRHIVPLNTLSRDGAWTDPHRLPDRIVLTPMIGSYMYLTPAGYRWVDENCRLEAQFGRYCFYRVTGAYPKDPAVLETHVVYQPPAPLAKPAWGD
jgi:hypothetical protein